MLVPVMSGLAVDEGSGVAEGVPVAIELGVLVPVISGVAVGEGNDEAIVVAVGEGSAVAVGV